MKPRLLDLFCGAGGAAMGYHRAGFEVVGVDIRPQPRYPFEFVQADALSILRGMVNYPTFSGEMWRPNTYAAIHASPPCQAFTAYRRRGQGVGDRSSDLVGETRALLDATALPWVMENVEGSPVRPYVKLCGSSFGLDVRRHRVFETNVPMMSPPCQHRDDPRFPPATNRSRRRSTVEVGVWRIPLKTQQQAMGIDWMTREELSQAIPPAYCQFIGEQLLASLAVTS